jgi:alkylation response protein AidB-like acyl-CoA dehydrogenase
MQTEFSKEQHLFREVVARGFKEWSPPSAIRQWMASDAGYDPSVWQQVCGEVGLSGVHVPEAYGGSGFGPIELGIVSEEMGRALYCGPFFASAVMAGCALLIAASEEHKKALLPGICSGSTIATLVLDDLNEPDRIGRSIRATDRGSLSGGAGMVVDAQVSDLLIVVATTTAGLGLYAVDREAAGVSLVALEVLDPTRKLSSVTLDNAPGQRIGDVTAESLNRIWDQICTALAHEMIGGAEYLLASTVEYTKVRFQFGRPIGSFQALKHRCADLLMEVELARATTHHAARCLASGDGEPYAASMAKAMASDTFMSAAKAGIQLRGGIGFTWEDDTHLWFKRAKSSEVFLGAPHLHRERMMTIVEGQS